MPAALAPIAGAVVGGLLSDDQQASASREPWGPAQPWLKRNIEQGQSLQDFYTQNPFSPMQQQAYRNLFANIDNFNTNMAPSLLSLVNKYVPTGGAAQGGAAPSEASYNISHVMPTNGARTAVMPTNEARAAVMPSPTNDMVEAAYRGIGRTGIGSQSNQIDQDGWNYWTKQLQSGAIKPDQFQDAFNASVNQYMAEKPNDRYTQYVGGQMAMRQPFLGLLNFERDNPFRNGAVRSMAALQAQQPTSLLQDMNTYDPSRESMGGY